MIGTQESGLFLHAQKHVDFEFILTMRPNGQYAVMALVEGRTLYKDVQHHWMHDALIINVTSGKVGYGLVGISFELATIEVIYD
jgi:lipopolysaccharide transport system ATP-binding protein